MGTKNNIFKTLKDYEEIFDRPFPQKYDVLKLGEEHRRLDALMRRHWAELHPLSRDLFTSFAGELQLLIHEMDELENKVKHLEEETLHEIDDIKNKYSDKINNIEEELETASTQRSDTISNERINELIKLNQKLQSEKEKIKLKLSEKQELINTQREEINLLIDHSDIEIRSKKELEVTISESFENVNTFTSQLETLEAEFNQADGVIQEKEEKIVKLKQLYRDKIDDLSSNYARIKNKLVEITPVIESIENENNSLKDQNDTLKKQIEELSHLKEDYLGSKYDNTELRKSNQHIVKSLQNAEDQISKLSLQGNQQKSPKTIAPQTIEIEDFAKPKPETDFKPKINKQRQAILVKQPSKAIAGKSAISSPLLNQIEKEVPEKVTIRPTNIIDDDANKIKDIDSVKTIMLKTIKKIEKERSPENEIKLNLSNYDVSGSDIMRKVKELTELPVAPSDRPKRENQEGKKRRPQPA